MSDKRVGFHHLDISGVSFLFRLTQRKACYDYYSSHSQPLLQVIEAKVEQTRGSGLFKILVDFC